MLEKISRPKVWLLKIVGALLLTFGAAFLPSIIELDLLWYPMLPESQLPQGIAIACLPLAPMGPDGGFPLATQRNVYFDGGCNVMLQYNIIGVLGNLFFSYFFITGVYLVVQKIRQLLR